RAAGDERVLASQSSASRHQTLLLVAAACFTIRTAKKVESVAPTTLIPPNAQPAPMRPSAGRRHTISATNSALDPVAISSGVLGRPKAYMIGSAANASTRSEVAAHTAISTGVAAT